MELTVRPDAFDPHLDVEFQAEGERRTQRAGRPPLRDQPSRPAPPSQPAVLERQEIHEGLQVVENWNSASKDLFHGKHGDLVGQDKESQEVSILALHLLQSALVHVTLLVQQVLADPKWAEKLSDADRRALSPLFWTHVNRYGRFELEMNSRLGLDLAVAVRVPGPGRAQDVVAAVPV
ncbi:Tn3 family transposase [Streptomyces sp. SAI-149]|uniref:Tn3 family transposase n=1 Tax=Streptomyces sp. SAI-149 TaxID=2940542 RepID=UPI002473E9AD|nr:Tn3 family transposase [Streptomyces sp. SAI-149]MDH6502426.1 hypothetical protein [Streptomyces sp. SAI-149]